MSRFEKYSVDDRIFFEQLLVPLRSMHWDIYPGLLLLLLINFALSAPCNQMAVDQWCIVAALTWLCTSLHARKNAKLSLDRTRADRLLLELKLLYAFEGAVWGALPWVTMDSCSATQGALSIVFNAGVAAGRMIPLAPLPAVYLVYIVVGGTVWIAKMFSSQGVPYLAIAIAGILFVLTLIIQIRVHYHTLVKSIRLRFENELLTQELNRQMEIANVATRDAENANQAKTKFLAAASHDLRQPLQAQGMFLEVFSRMSLGEEQSQVLGSLRSAYTATTDMLNTLLDYSRIEAGVIHPVRQGFSLQGMLSKIEIEFGPQADVRNLVFRVRETNLLAYSDPALVEQILRNLISNALRYTEKGGVLIACRRRGAEVLLGVWDTGVGIPGDQQKAVFQEFLQLGNSERDRNKGLGLGLSIVDGLARCLGHPLIMRSVPGRGSQFQLVLPLGTVQSVAPVVLDDEVMDECHADILLIDDDQSVRESTRQLLNSWGCRCDVAETAEEAMALARKHPPGLVVSDYRLRGALTGAHVIVALRYELGANLPALLITGDTHPERIAEATASGIPLLHKPVAPLILYRKIRELLAHAG